MAWAWIPFSPAPRLGGIVSPPIGRKASLLKHRPRSSRLAKGQRGRRMGTKADIVFLCRHLNHLLFPLRSPRLMSAPSPSSPLAPFLSVLFISHAEEEERGDDCYFHTLQQELAVCLEIRDRRSHLRPILAIDRQIASLGSSGLIESGRARERN